MLPLKPTCFWIVAFLLTVAVITSNRLEAEESAAAEHAAIHFSQDIRPLLSDHCFACHGPDENRRESGVRLDTAEGVASVIDPDSWDESLLIERIRSADSDMMMPPPGFQKPLSEEAISTLERWVQGGAEFHAHWAFTTPSKADSLVAQPDASELDRIDRWINHALAQKKLSANGPADRATLARRVSLDLTGLPPSWDQVTRFINDDDAAAYEKYVDELLASPAYGEHIARYWLDLVRYGDTHGLHLDNYREMWPYRDWVISAFNDNKPFDEFITEQLAGDLLPAATRAQKIASGFNRLNVTTSEGGSIYEEVFARNVIDRTDAFGTIFLGLTTGCAVCHDHKFDPISQRDYFSLSAFFNSLDGRALDGNVKDHPPNIAVPNDQQTQAMAEIAAELASIEEQLKGPLEEVDAAEQEWVRSLGEELASRAELLLPHDVKSQSETKTEIVDDSIVRLSGEVADKDTIELICKIPTGQWQTLELAALVDDKNKRVGTASNGNAVLSEIVLQTRSAADAPWQPLGIASGGASSQQNDGDFAVERAFDGDIDDSRGWAVGGHQSEGGRTAWFHLNAPLDSPAETPLELRIELHYQSKFAGHLLRDVQFHVHESATAVPTARRLVMGDVHLAGPLPVEDPNAAFEAELAGEKSDSFEPAVAISLAGQDYPWQHRSDVLPIVVNELPHQGEQPSVTLISQSIKSPSAQTVSLMIGSDDGYVVYLNGKEIAQSPRAARELDPLSASHELKLRAGENRLTIKHVHYQNEARLTYALQSPLVSLPQPLAESLLGVQSDGNQLARLSLRRFYRRVHSDTPQWLALQDLRRGVLKLQADTQAAIPTTLIWKETQTPRPAHVLLRGEYDAPGDVVPRSVPAFLPPLPADVPVDRLALAQWLTSADHPLTARVAVNRFWQQLFGTGLVKTSEDFGSQGTPPSHPELLDELAIDFRESGWDVKALMKRLVMTQAYRRDAKATPEVLRQDPNNRLLARGPRFRLDAEMLRDQMLATSGLLVNRLGGLSVKPPQPAGLWAAVGYTGSNTATFVPDTGDKIYRRSVYTFWKRTSAPAVLTTFDAPSRESCTARRERTNTPLQALLMLNEPQTMIASQALASEVIAAAETQPGSPDQQLRRLFEQVVLRAPQTEELESLSRLLTDLTNHYSADLENAARLVGAPDAPLAAWTIVANTLLNLDEVVCK